MGGFGFSVSAISAVRNNRALTYRKNAIADFKRRAKDTRLAATNGYYTKREDIHNRGIAKSSKEYNVKSKVRGGAGSLWILSSIIMLFTCFIIAGILLAIMS